MTVVAFDLDWLAGARVGGSLGSPELRFRELPLREPALPERVTQPLEPVRSLQDRLAPDLESPEVAFDTLGKVVWRFLRRSGVAHSNLDDATQDVFLVVVRRWRDFRGDSTRKTWVIGIAAKVASAYRKRQQKLRCATESTYGGCGEDLDPCGVVPGHGSWSLGCDPLESVARRQASTVVDAVLARLSDEERSLFILVDMEGFSVPEVAPALGLEHRRAHTVLERVRRTFEAEIRRHLARDGRGSP